MRRGSPRRSSGGWSTRWCQRVSRPRAAPALPPQPQHGRAAQVDAHETAPAAAPPDTRPTTVQLEATGVMRGSAFNAPGVPLQDACPLPRPSRHLKHASLPATPRPGGACVHQPEGLHWKAPMMILAGRKRPNSWNTSTTITAPWCEPEGTVRASGDDGSPNFTSWPVTSWLLGP